VRLEEVQDHEVGMPEMVQVGQRVEDVEPPRTDVGQRLANGDGEPLEADRRIDQPDVHS